MAPEQNAQILRKGSKNPKLLFVLFCLFVCMLNLFKTVLFNSLFLLLIFSKYVLFSGHCLKTKMVSLEAK